MKGDLQTSRRENVSSGRRVEVEKFKTRLKGQELDSKSKSKVSTDKLMNAVKLETEKLRLRGQAQEKNEKLRKKGE